MTVPHGYHFTLDIGGVNYAFVLPRPEQYYVSDVSDWTRRSAPSGSLVRGDEIASFEQRSFHGGMGQVEMREESLYQMSEGTDSRTPGRTTLYTKRNRIELTSPHLAGSLTTTAGLVDDTECLIVGGEGGVVAWDGNELYDLSSTARGIREVYHNGTHLFVGLDSEDTLYRGLYRFTGTLTSPAWTSTSSLDPGHGGPRDVAAFCVHDGYFWCAQQTARSNLIHYTQTDDFAGFEGDTSANANHPLFHPDGDALAVEVGPIGYPVKKLVSWDGALYAFREDGIWRVQLDLASGSPSVGKYIAIKLFDYDNQRSTANFNGSLYWNGALWWNVRDKIFRWTGGTLVPGEPQEFELDYPPSPHTPPHSFYALDNQMYVLLGDQLYVTGGEGARGGSAWHRLSDIGLSTTTDAVLGYFHNAPDYSRLCAITTNGDISYLDWWRADDEFSRAEFTPRGWLRTSRFDDGNVTITKSWEKITVMGHIPDEGGRIQVTAYSYDSDQVTAYMLGNITRLDGPAYVPVLGETDIPSSEWNRPVVEMRFPRTAKGKQIALQFDLFADPDSETTPVLYSYNLSFIPRPAAVYGYRPTLHLADYMPTTDGRPGPYDSNTLLQLLIAARNSSNPLEYEDFLGNRARVHVSAIRYTPRFVRPNQAGVWNNEQIEYEVVLSLIEIERFECPDVLIERDTEEDGPYRAECTVRITGDYYLRVTN